MRRLPEPLGRDVLPDRFVERRAEARTARVSAAVRAHEKERAGDRVTARKVRERELLVRDEIDAGR